MAFGRFFRSSIYNLFGTAGFEPDLSTSTLVRIGPCDELVICVVFERPRITIIYLLWRIGVHIASAYFLRYNSALYHLEAVLRDRSTALPTFLGSGILDPHSFDGCCHPTTKKLRSHENITITNKPDKTLFPTSPVLSSTAILSLEYSTQRTYNPLGSRMRGAGAIYVRFLVLYSSYSSS
jgi:hypothetical protein